MTDSIWTQGSSLGISQGWTSGNGRAILRLQEDGNLVLYKNSKAVWQAPHAVNLGDHARMQDDGNFVLDLINTKKRCGPRTLPRTRVHTSQSRTTETW